MRVLVTGSRTWTDREFLWGVLAALAKSAADEGYEIFTVVHGGAAGADYLADRWVWQLPVTEPDLFRRFANGVGATRHPAEWRKYGRQAGFIRNQAMVNLGADFCAAFILPCAAPKCRRKTPHGTHGASKCAELAEAAGIRTERFEVPT